MTAVDVDVEHRPGPTPDEAPYSRYCQAEGCGGLWPCQARLDSIETVPGPSRRDLEPGEEATLDRIGLGWVVTGAEGMRFHQRSGGTVVDYRGEDDDRVFRVLRWHHGQPVVVNLARADVEPTGVSEPNKYYLENHAVCLAEHVAKGCGGTEEKLEWLRMAVICMERAV